MVYPYESRWNYGNHLMCHGQNMVWFPESKGMVIQPLWHGFRYPFFQDSKKVGWMTTHHFNHVLTINHTQMLYVWNIYLQNWAMFRVNVGKSSSTMVRIWDSETIQR